MSKNSVSHALAEPLLSQGKHPLLERCRAYIWLMVQLGRAVPGPFCWWLTIRVMQGLMPPFQLWASGQLVGAIQSRLDGDEGNPWMWMLAMACALAGVRLLDPLKNLLEAGIHERGLAQIEGRVLSRITEVDLALLEYQAFYDVTRRIAEQASQSLKDALKALSDVVGNAVPLIGAIVIIGRIDYRLVLVLLVPLMPILITALRQGAFVWNALRQQTRDRRIAQYIAARFSDRQSAKEIRLFGLADELIKRWEQHYLATRKEIRGKTTRAGLRLQLSGTVADLLSYGAVIWLITSGSLYASAAEITVFMGAFMTIGNQSFNLQQAILNIGNYSGFAQDIRLLLGLPTPFASQPILTHVQGSEPIVLEHVSFTYPGTDTRVIDDISLSIPPGQTLAIVGENGAGKTTLLKIMLGLYQPDAGTIRIGDRDIRSIPVAERQARMAAVFQTVNRYPETMAENITMPLPVDERELNRVVTEAGLEDIIRSAANGLETILSPDLGGTDLSGGQWQRLAIARASYRSADILALDEPTSALDPVAEVDVFQRFSALSQNRTTILVSHRLGMARLADRIIVLEHGKITEDGSHTELVRNRGHYAELWEMQSRWYL